MPQIILTDDQVRVLKAARGKVDMVNSQGEIIGIAKPPVFTAERLERIRRVRASGKRGFSVAEKNEFIAKLVKELELQGK